MQTLGSGKDSKDRAVIHRSPGLREGVIAVWIQIALIALCLNINEGYSAESIWVKLPLDRQPFSEIDILLAKHHHSTLGGQTYTARIRNVSNSRVKVTGSVVADLTCGNSKQTDFEINIKPGESVGGDAYLTDTIGLSGEIFKEDCAGERIPDPMKSGSFVYNRIRGVRLVNLRLINLDQQAFQARQEQERLANERREREQASIEAEARRRREREAAEERIAAETAARQRQEQLQAAQQEQVRTLQRNLDELKEEINRTVTRERRPEAAKECFNCNGKGTMSCLGCSGTGKIPAFPTPLTCAVCSGKGRSVCILCSGSGKKN